jgi:hypothetical protein
VPAPEFELELRRLRSRFASLHDESSSAPLTHRRGTGLLVARGKLGRSARGRGARIDRVVESGVVVSGAVHLGRHLVPVKIVGRFVGVVG